MNIEVGKKYMVISSENPTDKNSFIITPTSVFNVQGAQVVKISHLFLGVWVEISADGTIITSWPSNLIVIGECKSNVEEMQC